MAPLAIVEDTDNGIWYGVWTVATFVVVSAVLILCARGKKKKGEKEQAVGQAVEEKQQTSKIEPPGGGPPVSTFHFVEFRILRITFLQEQKPILAVSGRAESVQTASGSSSLSGARKSVPLPTVRSFR